MGEAGVEEASQEEAMKPGIARELIRDVSVAMILLGVMPVVGLSAERVVLVEHFTNTG